MRLTRLTIAVVAAAALLFAACGGDDDDSASSNASAYEQALAAAFSKRAGQAPIANSQKEADCTANKIIADVGERRLVAAGLTAEVLKSGSLGSSGLPKLSAEDASAIVDAIFECIDVGQSLGRQLVAGGANAEQSKCLGNGLENSQAFHGFYESILREGSAASMDRSTAEEVVDTLFKCVGQGEFFRSSVAGSITITDAQAKCLDEALASNSDYRDALVASFAGEPPAGEPPFRDEVEKCVPPEQLTPTSPASPPTTG
jgi:hypothetical protein